jgi:hypothetical protein
MPSCLKDPRGRPPRVHFDQIHLECNKLENLCLRQGPSLLWCISVMLAGGIFTRRCSQVPCHGSRWRSNRTRFLVTEESSASPAYKQLLSTHARRYYRLTNPGSPAACLSWLSGRRRCSSQPSAPEENRSATKVCARKDEGRFRCSARE